MASAFRQVERPLAAAALTAAAGLAVASPLLRWLGSTVTGSVAAAQVAVAAALVGALVAAGRRSHPAMGALYRSVAYRPLSSIAAIMAASLCWLAASKLSCELRAGDVAPMGWLFAAGATVAGLRFALRVAGPDARGEVSPPLPTLSLGAFGLLLGGAALLCAGRAPIAPVLDAVARAPVWGEAILLAVAGCWLVQSRALERIEARLPRRLPGSLIAALLVSALVSMLTGSIAASRSALAAHSVLDHAPRSARAIGAGLGLLLPSSVGVLFLAHVSGTQCFARAAVPVVLAVAALVVIGTSRRRDLVAATPRTSCWRLDWRGLGERVVVPAASIVGTLLFLALAGEQVATLLADWQPPARIVVWISNAAHWELLAALLVLTAGMAVLVEELMVIFLVGPQLAKLAWITGIPIETLGVALLCGAALGRILSTGLVDPLLRETDRGIAANLLDSIDHRW